MLARPKIGEDEDEILKLQEDFIKTKQRSAATVINKRKFEHEKSGFTVNVQHQDVSSKKSCSKFASAKKNTHHDNKTENTRNTVKADVLGDIVEKNVTAITAPSLKSISRQGFPTPFVRDKSLIAKDKSIFAQQIEKSKTNSLDMEIDEGETLQSSVIKTATFGERSFVITGPDAQTIHQENLEKLSKMSSEEIIKEQQELVSQIDPKLLDFIRNKKKSKNSVSEANEVPIQVLDSHLLTGDNGSTREVQNLQKVEIDETVEMSCDSIIAPSSDHSSIDLPIQTDKSKKWLHMDVMELEKLQWIGDIAPAPSVPPNTPYSARFNFEGILLPYAEDTVNVTQALHHHGEEPERPGYTLQELLQLSRSKVLQQRVIALTTIANILEKTKAGFYDECMETPLLTQLVDSDLYLLLRFSLDDNAEAVVTATLLALQNLLWNQADELCLDRLLGIWNNLCQPSLVPKSEVTKPSEKQELKEDEAELKDHQILRLDMIKGALRTDIILRLRYILEVMKPCPKAVICVLNILLRIVRHSHEAALAVTCCPRLLSTIIMNFVPRDWRGIIGTSKPSEMSSVYNVPLVEALKLLRIIASSSRAMTSDLVHKFGVMEAVVSYISIDPRECGIPQLEALKLSLESIYLWNTIMAYNFATIHFVNMYPVIMRLLQFHLSATSAEDITSSFGHEHGAAIMTLLTEAITVADAQEKRAASQKVANLADRIIVTMTHEHVSGFTDLQNLCLKKWITQLTRTEQISFTSLKLVAASLNCCAVRYIKFHGQPNVDSIVMLEEISEIMKSTIEPFMSSQNFKLICKQIKSNSCLLSRKSSGKNRDPHSLPSLGSLVWGGREVVPSIGPTSQLILLQSLAHFLAAVCSIHRGVHLQVICDFLQNPYVLEYISALSSQKLEGLDNWFIRIEISLLTDILKLLTTILAAVDFKHVNLYHSLALRLVAVIPANKKILIKEICTHVIFSHNFFRDYSDVEFRLNTLKLSDIAPYDKQGSIHTLLEKALEKITSLWQFYQTALGLAAVSEHGPLDVSTQFVVEDELEPAFPNDWCYIPLLKMYNQAISRRDNSSISANSVVNCLQWLLIMECLRPQVISTSSVTTRFCRLSLVFLIGTDLFLEHEVRNHMDVLLSILLKNNYHLNFNEKIPDLTSFYDLYLQLVEQFSAVSYGDELFGQFVLIPLQQRHSPMYRKYVWSEQAGILRILRTKPEQLVFPVKEFLEPLETDPSLLMSYLHGLATGQVREIWCPVLHQAAMHHVAMFIRKEQGTNTAKQLIARIQKMGNKEIQTKLLHFVTEIGEESVQKRLH